MPEITKICHGLTIGDLKFGNARPGVVEATLKPGETMEEALDELDERLNAWHRKRYPHLYQEEKGWTPWADFPPHMKTEVTFSNGALPIISRDKEKIEIAIDNAESVEELKIIKKAYELMPASCLIQYNKKMAELTTGRPQNFTDGL